MKQQTRYTWGGEDTVAIQFSEDMELERNFLAMAVSEGLRNRHHEAVIDICPLNTSLLVRFDPLKAHPNEMRRLLEEIEHEVAENVRPSISTRIIEIPVWYSDPYTHEVGARFRDRHQRPDLTDLEYAASECGYASEEEFIEAHSSAPWFAAGVGFVAGLPYLFQMVPRERQIQLPKYLRPRTETPGLTVGHGGCFTAIYAVPGAGGYQMFGISPAPIFDMEQRLAAFADSPVLFIPGDIVQFRRIEEPEYREILEEVEKGSFEHKILPFDFSLDDYSRDYQAFASQVKEALDAH